MIRPLSFGPSGNVVRPRLAAATPSLDRLTLSGQPERPRGFWGKLSAWALGATQEQAVEQDGVPAAAVKVAQAPIPDLTLDPSLGLELTRLAVGTCTESTVKNALSLAGLKRSLSPSTPAQTALSLLSAVPGDYPTTRENVGNALLKELKGHLSASEALELLRAYPSNQRGGVAEACLETAERDLPEVSRLSTAMLGASTESSVRGLIAEHMLSSALAGQSPPQAALALLRRFPANCRKNVCQVVLDRLPEMEQIRSGVKGCGEVDAWNAAVMAGIEQQLAGASPTQIALSMLKAVPSDHSTSAANIAANLIPRLPNTATAVALIAVLGDDNGRRLTAQTCLEGVLRQQSPRQQVLSALEAVTRAHRDFYSDLTTTRSNLMKAAADNLGDPHLRAALGAVSESTVLYDLGLTWLREAEKCSPPAVIVLKALQAIPSEYPTTRARACAAAFVQFDSPLASLTSIMANACTDDEPKWSLYQSSLTQLQDGEPASLVGAAAQLISGMPSDYITAQRNAALICARHLSTIYTDPGSQGLLNSASSTNDVLEALQQIKNRLSIQQQVEDLARAVAGQEQTRVIEQREGLLVVGGTRVKVREAPLGPTEK
ncbi:hypothetical protein DYH09_17075 [bacterium CPR1]|nr:hypothetical protein [bacterium CPR1]